ncbi:GNAT family N-acetyltransferase [Cellulosimicrobium sp. CUA-896]|uniref:GNAT family N-acetyltransferase n=1 Tax=Cellulosimicrobium sp. CUA-896 TaxID=1517881 RepID=UPI000965C5CA|nr:GNAT family protein [Cellulosimicrobium sp. CUA-896]OLT55218.1 GNAT family N-acetyltransferase [Cellulosimicrobium sp. CUA-896]
MQPFALDDGTVHLAAPTLDDVDAITAACQDPDIAAWTVLPSPYTRDDALGFVRDHVAPGWERGDVLTWAVRESVGPSGVPGPDGLGPLLGMVGLGLDDAPASQRSAELGYWMTPAGRGRGLATAAGRLVVDAAFDPEVLGLARLSWQAYVGNWPSRRLAWRLGFRVEGTVRGHAVQRGVRRDAWVATLLADDPREPAEPWTHPVSAARTAG